jgi:RNA polymerase sigma-70 factor, ECF subfamily
MSVSGEQLPHLSTHPRVAAEIGNLAATGTVELDGHEADNVSNSSDADLGEDCIPALVTAPGGAVEASRTLEGSAEQRMHDELDRAFNAIYEEYRTPVFNYVYHLVGNRDEAADLTQDTFVKVYRALPSRTDGSLSAWLYRIATNTAYDVLRRRKLIGWKPLQDLVQEPAAVGSADDPQETYGTVELVRAALRRMPQSYRAALLLYTQEGYSYSEVAKALNISEKGVKMYLSRSRQSFREHYQAVQGDGGVQ